MANFEEADTARSRSEKRFRHKHDYGAATYSILMFVVLVVRGR